MKEKNISQNTKKQVLFIWGGLLFSIIGIITIGFSIFYMTRFDRVEGLLEIRKIGPRNSTRAYITYEYDDVIYEDIGLNSYNAFTMKDNKQYTVYINPNNQHNPKTTNFALGTLALLLGVVAIVVGKKY